MKEKKGGFLRWPWNIAVYVLLLIALRLFAIPVILILMGIQRRNNPHGIAEGYCLSRTQRKLSWAAWGLLCLVLAAGLFCMFYVGLRQDPAYRETMDYVTLTVCSVGGVLLLALGSWMAYTGLRDTFFPEKSSLADSIRSQLPYPEEAPPAAELFAMVDRDLKANGQWFDAMGIGQEWVLGELANRIDRIRGIFAVDEIQRRHSGGRINTQRILQLVLIDDRWQKHITDFKKPQELRAAADCLALRVPDARRGTNGQWSGFWNMDESQREDFEREFRQKQSLRASENLQREAVKGGSQDMILQAGEEVTSRVTSALVEEHLRRCLEGGLERFTLTPTRPIEAAGQPLRALHAAAPDNKTLRLTIEPANAPGGETLGLVKEMPVREARETLEAWLRREAPDLETWDLRRVYDSAARRTPDAPSKSAHRKLSLVYASGAAENHTTFTREDVQLAAEGIVDGTYQLVDLTHDLGYLWIRVTAGDKDDARCTVEATKPGGPELEFYIAKMTPREAAAWLTGYPHGPFLPGGGNWKRVKK